jgi:hypothetical protein
MNKKLVLVAVLIITLAGMNMLGSHPDRLPQFEVVPESTPQSIAEEETKPYVAKAPTSTQFGKTRIENRKTEDWERPKASPQTLKHYDRIFNQHPQYSADGFDFPVGKPDGRGYYVARKFQEARHLGDDMNAVTGGNTDLGHPIYAIANGFVSFSHDLEGGWGNTLRIVHKMPDGSYVESLYSHCNELFVEYGDFVKRGDEIATIGTAHGLYPAHLHLELRTEVDMPLGRGYSNNPEGYTSPTRFIWKNRPRW